MKSPHNPKRMLRLYCDTAIFGGSFDEEFALDSRRLMRMARRGDVKVLVSEAVLNELIKAPDRVWDVFASIPDTFLEIIKTTDEVKQLQLAYFDAKVLTEKWALDAFHVAAATYANADAVVSWNFRHLVRIDREGV